MKIGDRMDDPVPDRAELSKRMEFLGQVFAIDGGASAIVRLSSEPVVR